MRSRIKKHRIYSLLSRYEEKLVNAYIKDGPIELRKKLDLESDAYWNLIMQYLVYEKEVVKLCINRNPEYIYNFFVEHGPTVLRRVFDIENKYFDEAWECVIDYLGISRGALYAYVSNNANEFKKLIYSGKPLKIRKMLNLDKEKYINAWNEILDILLESVSTEKFSFGIYEQGMRMFINMYNQGRKHKRLHYFKKDHLEA